MTDETPEDPMERRQFSRVNYQTLAMVDAGESSFEGVVQNLSLNGVLIGAQPTTARGTVAKGTPVMVKLWLTGVIDELSITLKGEVVRSHQLPSQDPSGVELIGTAIRFALPMDIEALTVLRNIVGYNLGDPEGVMREYCQFLDRRREIAEPVDPAART